MATDPAEDVQPTLEARADPSALPEIDDWLTRVSAPFRRSSDAYEAWRSWAYCMQDSQPVAGPRSASVERLYKRDMPFLMPLGDAFRCIVQNYEARSYFVQKLSMTTLDSFAEVEGKAHAVSADFSEDTLAAIAEVWSTIIQDGKPGLSFLGRKAASANLAFIRAMEAAKAGDDDRVKAALRRYLRYRSYLLHAALSAAAPVVPAAPEGTEVDGTPGSLPPDAPCWRERYDGWLAAKAEAEAVAASPSSSEEDDDESSDDEDDDVVTLGRALRAAQEALDSTATPPASPVWGEGQAGEDPPLPPLRRLSRPEQRSGLRTYGSLKRKRN